MDNFKDLILTIRGEKVILDFNLAKLYGVSTKALKQSVRRNIERFPDEFMIILNDKEIRGLRSQFVTATHKTYNRSTPWAFTELGVAMLSSVLKSKKAIEINIMIIKIFVQIRKAYLLNSNIELKLKSIEDELSNHSIQLKLLFDELTKISEDKSDSKIGFKVN